MQPRISMITLGVKNLKQAIGFYQQGLGLPRRAPYSDDIAFFELNGTWLGLYPWDKLAEDVTVPAEGLGFRGVTLAHNVKSKEEVNRVMSQAVEAGATLVKEPQDVFWGGYSGYFSDLDGHLWEIAWNPYLDRPGRHRRLTVDQPETTRLHVGLNGDIHLIDCSDRLTWNECGQVSE